MGLERIIAVLVFLVLNFVLAILLESKLTSSFTFELVFIVIGIILSIAMLLGMSFETNWAWPLATILFSAFLANAVFLYIGTDAFVGFTGLVLVNVLGLLMSVLSIRDHDPFMPGAAPLENYDSLPDVNIQYQASKVRKTKKKKK